MKVLVRFECGWRKEKGVKQHACGGEGRESGGLPACRHRRGEGGGVAGMQAKVVEGLLEVRLVRLPKRGGGGGGLPALRQKWSNAFLNLGWYGFPVRLPSLRMTAS